MFVQCERCEFRSGVWSDRKSLAVNVVEFGGSVDAAGWTCPNGHPVEVQGKGGGLAWPQVYVKPGTIGAVIMLAAADLAALDVAIGGTGVFHVSPLIVKAWQSNPSRLGLHGYVSQYPDSNRVICEVVKFSNGRGLMRRVGPRQYELTELGRKNVEALKESANRA